MVIQNENILIEDLAKKKIVELSEGDMRKSLNLLQSLYMINSQFENNIITLSSVYKLVGHPSDDERDEIINTLNNKDLKSIYQTLNKLESEKSLSNQDIIKEISSYFGKTFILNYKNQKLAKLKSKSKSKLANIRMEIKEQIKILDLFDKLAKIEVNISTNTNTNIQLLAISSIINNYNY
jgi:replication factor C subunit 3/5